MGGLWTGSGGRGATPAAAAGAAAALVEAAVPGEDGDIPPPTRAGPAPGEDGRSVIQLITVSFLGLGAGAPHLQASRDVREDLVLSRRRLPEELRPVGGAPHRYRRGWRGRGLG